MEWAIRATDVAIVLATIAGPVLAVEAQKHLDRIRGVDDRRRNIFKTLMATRAATLSGPHVEALNAVPVEFHGRGASLKRINDAWKEYLDHLNFDGPATEVWAQKRADLFFNLLSAISDNLKYNFSRSQLQKDVYSPRGHASIEAEQTAIRQGLANVLSGKGAIPMAVVEFPNMAEPQPPSTPLLDGGAPSPDAKP